MTKQAVPLVGQPYKMQALQLNSQTCINWYVTIDETGKYPEALLPTDGLHVFTELPSQKIVRGMFELNNLLYVVAGNKFYTVTTDGSFIEKGTLKTATGNIRMVPNKNQIFMSDGVVAYVYQYKASTSHPFDDFFEVKTTTSNIGDPTFTGSGLNDMSTHGDFSGIVFTSYTVEIQTKGTPDKFRWSSDDGKTWTNNIIITGLEQLIDAFGTKVQFEHLTGHTIQDKWDFQATPDSTFFVPVIPGYQDGYGIYIKQNSDRFYISSIGDFSQINSLDSAEENIWPDYLKAAISLREELWLIGRTISRIWYDTGNVDFPFEPRTNLAIKYGTLAPYSVAVGHDNILFWLGNNDEGGRVAIMVAEYSPRIISTEPLHNAWNDYTTVDDVIGFVLQKDGHIFYHLIFPTANKTWVYDATTKLWHEKQTTYFSPTVRHQDKIQGRWRGNNYAYFAGKHLVGDWESGKIFYLDNKMYKDDDIEIRRERTSRVIDKDLQRIFLNSLQVDMAAGTGLTNDAAQGYDPEVMLQISKDDGVTWGNELWRKIGKIGNYAKRIKWNRLGSGRSFTFRLRTTDPVYNVVLGAAMEMELSDT